MSSIDPDRPSFHATAAKLDADDHPEPFVFMTSAGHRCVFPDPFDMEWEAAEEFMQRIEGMSNSAQALQDWLSPEDYAALKDERLTLRQGMNLVAQIQRHYSSFLGNPGEGGASES